MTLRGCQMPAGPTFSPSQSNILGSPPPALLTETGQIQGQLRSPSSESAQSGAAAAITKIQRVEKGVKNTSNSRSGSKVILLKVQNLDKILATCR